MEYFILFIALLVFVTGLVFYMLARILEEMDDSDIDID